MAIKTQTLRRLLIVGIVVAGGFSIYLHFRLAEKREAAAEAAANRPETRFNEALQAADRAAINRDPAAGWTALVAAQAAADEALAEHPNDPRLLRARLIVARRLGQVAELRNRSADARAHLTDAVKRSEALFATDPTDERNRADRLNAARELSALLLKIPAVDEAARVSTDAAEAVEQSAATVPPLAPVRMLLGEVWLDAARAFAEAKDAPRTIECARKALVHAEAGRGPEEDPLTATSRASTVSATAVELAEKVGDAAAAEAFERDAVRLLEARQRLEPDDIAVRRTLAARLVRLADHAQAAGRFDEAEALHARSVEVRRALHIQYPADADALRDLVRGLNHQGAFFSDRDRDAEALTAYAEAAALAGGLEGDDRRSALVTIGNHAQLLGRRDRIPEARAEAERALALATTLAAETPADERAVLDLANAELRLARLLRSVPQPDYRRAREVAQSG
ncbi:MAG: hypothetical protein KC620_23725, partial [Myxococcales bacterium]|nr:hypothetical protein [Myxococcales bacterium]